MTDPVSSRMALNAGVGGRSVFTDPYSGSYNVAHNNLNGLYGSNDVKITVTASPPKAFLGKCVILTGLSYARSNSWLNAVKDIS